MVFEEFVAVGSAFKSESVPQVLIPSKIVCSSGQSRMRTLVVSCDPFDLRHGLRRELDRNRMNPSMLCIY